MREDEATDPLRQEVATQRARALRRLVDVRRKAPEVETRTRKMVEWGERNGFAPKIHAALRGD